MMKYKITEICSQDDSVVNTVVDSHKVFRRVTDSSLVAYCNNCQYGGCIVEAEELND